MKILFASHSAALTGAPRILCNILTHLDRTHIEPLVLFPERGPFLEMLAEANIPTKLVAIGDSGWRKFHVPMIEALCIANDIDLIHANTIQCFPFPIAAERIGIPCLWHLHEMYTDESMYEVNKLDLKEALKAVSRVVPSSQASMDDFSMYCKRLNITVPPAAVVHNGSVVPAASCNPALRSTGNPVIVSFASFTMRKGLEFLLDAFALVNSKYEKAELTIIGEASNLPYVKKLYEQAEKLGIASKVKLRTPVENIDELLEAAVIVVNSSLMENFSMSIVEAMAYGKPIVATDVGAIREFFINDETGIIVPPKDADALAKAILSFMNDWDFALDCGRRARDHILQNFPISKQVWELERQYNDLAVSSPKQKAESSSILLEGLIAANEKIAEIENEFAGKYAFLNERIEHLERDVRILEGVVNNLLQKLPFRLYRKMAGFFK